VANREDIPYFSGPRPASSGSPTPEPAAESASESAAPSPDAATAADTHAEQRATVPRDDTVTAPPAPGPPARASHSGAHSGARRKALLVAAGALAVIVVFLGVWFVLYTQHKVTTPSIVARTPEAAERILNDHRLLAGDAHLAATSDFAPGLIMEQSPQTPTEVKPGSRVNVVVATATASVAVPDVFLADEAVAQKQLRGALFVPIVINAYSSEVPNGEVASQLPRAGDRAFTGSPVFIVASLGPGSPGVVVPNLIRKPSKVAASLLATESLFPRMLTVDAPGIAPDTVVDQTPPPGMTVPVGDSVAISVTAPSR
jgi:beta-lactam-binding protein with PASTA domain